MADYIKRELVYLLSEIDEVENIIKDIDKGNIYLEYQENYQVYLDKRSELYQRFMNINELYKIKTGVYYDRTKC